MKKTKIVVPALAVLLLSTAASVSGTVAWFSMNNTVTVSGMQVTTKVSSNLQIADGDAAHSESNYGDTLAQTRAGILEPASSSDGATFYYTIKGKGDGSATSQGTDGATTYTLYGEDTELENAYAKKAAYDDAFNTAYGIATPGLGTAASGHELEQNVVYGYIDYSFYLKAGYAKSTDRIALTKCNMLYKGASNYGAITSAWAWRVGMFVEKAAKDTTVADSAAVTAGVKTILNFETESENQTAGKAVHGLDDGALENVTNANVAAIVDTAPTLNTTQRYKVVVRLWLEGEDKSCNSGTFADLTNDWKLDLEFKLGNPDDSGYAGVQYITTTPAA